MGVDGVVVLDVELTQWMKRVLSVKYGCGMQYVFLPMIAMGSCTGRVTGQLRVTCRMPADAP